MLQINSVEHKSLKNTRKQGPCNPGEKSKNKLANSCHVKTVGTYARLEPTSQSFASSFFVYFRLVITWALTPTGLPRAVAS